MRSVTLAQPSLLLEFRCLHRLISLWRASQSLALFARGLLVLCQLVRERKPSGVVEVGHLVQHFVVYANLPVGLELFEHSLVHTHILRSHVRVEVGNRTWFPETCLITGPFLLRSEGCEKGLVHLVALVAE